MAAKPYKPCSLKIELDLKKDVLIWDNTEGQYECIATNCQPALKDNTYVIPAHGTANGYPAHMTDPSGQTYICVCGRETIKTDPKLIVK